MAGYGAIGTVGAKKRQCKSDGKESASVQDSATMGYMACGAT